ncbi:MAG: ABC transporter ATP-binding protein [Lachnospiraceae bacterium]|nr:ABC transporter ATP-binding protein [Lachnospiraceae bacterium]
MIELRDLTKKYDEFTAVDHLNLTIGTGEFFGLLGPNGAGKTTTIGMISTLLLPSEGEVLVDGERLTRRNAGLKRKISLITQEYSMRQDMTMDEIMEYQGRLYYMPVKKIRERSEELLEFCGLIDYRRRTVRKLSGGMKRKLMVCRALLTEPEILLLDEPTAGMDALARRQMWNLLKKLNGQSLTILLTTHYMEEAESLCGRVGLMYNGKLEETDSPRNLIDKLGRYAVDYTMNASSIPTRSAQDGTDLLQSRFFHEREAAIACLSESGGEATLRNTTLEDVFLEKVGKHLENR